jgi:folate-dependent phosphoribosylglycinamide formyltransferase PurN
MNDGLILIGNDNPTTWIVYNRLVREFGPFAAIIEESTSRRILIRNRLRKLGWLRVLGQMAFVGFIRPILRYQSVRRVQQLCRQNDMEPARPLSDVISDVANINEPEAVALIKKASPRVVIVNGTRILKNHVLQAVPAVFLNTHQGITPQYRGANGGYWALFCADPKHCGVTVHLDTGGIVGQALIEPTSKDNYSTYPYLQTAAALPLLSKAIRDALADKLITRPATGPSAVWYHPGIFQYLLGRLRAVR